MPVKELGPGCLASHASSPQLGQNPSGQLVLHQQFRQQIVLHLSGHLGQHLALRLACALSLFKAAPVEVDSVA